MGMLNWFLLSSFAGISLWLIKSRRGRRLYPPGPKPDPFVGNIRQMPTKNQWITYAEWANEYGPLTYLNVLGQSIVILNTQKAAIDLLEKRGLIYADRPHSVMCNDLVEADHHIGMRPYTPTLKKYRKTMASCLTPSFVQKHYWPTIKHETYKYLVRLLERPENFLVDLRTCEASIVLTIAYGNVKDGDYDLIEMAEENSSIFVESISGYVVDVLPILRYLPTWFPGAGFKRKAAYWKQQMKKNSETPFNMVKRLRTEGKAPISFCAALLDENEQAGGGVEEEIYIKDSAAAIFAAGSDTTLSLIQVFLLAMTMYPDAQIRGQEELDRVIGTDRLPDFKDRPRLPFMEALFLETMRWHPVGPLGIPHATSQDDIYEGYLIPAGTIVFANGWGISQDPQNYPNPELFDPTRWLPSEMKTGEPVPMDPRAYYFGYGRRACPGLHLGQWSAWIAMVSILATFNLRKHKDSEGRETPLKAEFGSEFISGPKPFACDISPRSEKVIDTIHEGVARTSYE